MILRPYQADVTAELERTVAAGKRRVIIVAPTGSGKTIIAASIIRNANAAGQRVLVLAHTREIIKQTSAKLYDNNIEHGIIQAGFMMRPDEAAQVASVQTLWARAVRSNRMELPSADLLIIDECHHCPARTYRKIIDAWPSLRHDRAHGPAPGTRGEKSELDPAPPLHSHDYLLNRRGVSVFSF
jgi:superfamily II DNA or RNA helicase